MEWFSGPYLEFHVLTQSGAPAIHLSAFGRDGFNDLKATLQALLGAEYKYDFDKGKKAFSLYATWETNYWWNLNNFVAFFSTINPSFLSMPNSDALILFGITGGLSFAY